LLKILDRNPTLYFHLQQQRLIEYIRQGKIQEALLFAQEELASQGEDNVSYMYQYYFDSIFKFQPEFLEELEKTMALLIFEDGSKSPIASLLNDAQVNTSTVQVGAK
jgi:hypothetical protein